jgi:hypothetical protein
LTLLAELGRAYPQSRWLKEVRALDVEIRQQSGQATRPESVVDEDLKVMAINGLLNTDPERAVPMLEKLLQGTPSRKLQDRALFVLRQSGSPRAREIVVKIAQGDTQPDLSGRPSSTSGVRRQTARPRPDLRRLDRAGVKSGRSGLPGVRERTVAEAARSKD